MLGEGMQGQKRRLFLTLNKYLTKEKNNQKDTKKKLILLIRCIEGVLKVSKQFFLEVIWM
jgi:hypothetical protein